MHSSRNFVAPTRRIIRAAALAIALSILLGQAVAQGQDAPPGGAGMILVSDADHMQLTRLVEDFVWRVDNGQAASIHELFIADGLLDTGQRAAGRAEIRAWGKALDERNLGIRHVLTNPRFVATGPDTASGTSTLTAYLTPADGSPATLPFSVGQDVDQFVRTPDGWRFVSRRWESFFRR